MAVRENDFAKINVGPTTLDAVADHGYLIPCLNGIPIPALAGQCIRTIRLGGPFFNFSILIGDIKKNQCVGIDPLEAGYDSLDSRNVRHVVIRSAVVREHRISKQKNAGDPNDHTEYYFFHSRTPLLFGPHLCAEPYASRSLVSIITEGGS